MLLAIDTATRWTGVALYNGDVVVAEMGWLSRQTQTIELAPAVAAMFARARITADQLTALGVAIGPGSYTGLRVGLSFAKGLALTHNLPLLGISTLDIVAAGIGRAPGQMGIVVEAGRRRVIVAYYRWQGKLGWQAITPPTISSWPDLLQDVAPKTTFAGEISPEAVKLMRKAAKRLRRVSAATSTRRAGRLAELSWLRWQQGDYPAAGAVTPVYMRDPAGNNNNTSK